LTYTVAVSNNDTSCPASSFTAQADRPAGWAVQFGAAALSVAAGATATTAMQVTSPSSVSTGTYTISPFVADTAHSASAHALYTVTTSGTAGSFTDDFDRADADALGNGWAPVSGTLMTRANMATNAPTHGMHMAARAGVVGATQTAAAQFTSTGSNLGPRFALLLRYQDPRNYYVCYRQAGGSSALRIARVVNGTEKILKAVAIKNPPLAQPFTLGCAVEPAGTPGMATITLTLDGVTTLTASDAALASGSVGFGLGHPSRRSGAAPSHHADHFTATTR
jgi:hypothetical protein